MKKDKFIFIAILSLLLFFMSPILSLPFILYGIFFSQKLRPLFGLLLAIFVGYLFLQIIPDDTKDLYRYIDIMNSYLRSDFISTMSAIWTNSDPISYSLMYFTSLIFEPKFIVFVAPIICYPIYLWILSDLLEEKNIRPKDRYIIIASFLCIFQIATTFLGIRYGISLALLTLGIYEDLHKHKNVSIICYIISVLMHSSAIFIIIARIAFFLFKKRIIAWYLLLLTLSLLINILEEFATSISSISIFNTFQDRFQIYTQPHTPIGTVYYISFFAGIIIMLSVFLSIIFKNGNSLKNILHLNLLVVIASLINFQKYYLASRYLTFSKVLFCTISLPIILINPKLPKFTKYTIVLLLLTLSLPTQLNGILDYTYQDLPNALFINKILWM